ncbi:FUSC family protein [Gluconobacter oxydans]|uniref:FUSC family protein n=1 Tax=Gluconobacter oxydans TaxID=442 RepID=UPI000798519A|nr:fusaric acid resistance protein [Gluconobacter oxydans]
MRPGLSPSRIWRLVCDPAPGRMGYALRMAAGCTTTVLVGEIWQVPELAVPALVTMALWQKDRVTNALAGVGVNVAVLILLTIIYGLIRLTLDHPMGLVIVIALLSFMFFFLGSASKLKPVAYMLGLITVYGLIAIDEVPVGEVVTRALLYTDLFLAVPGAVMVVLGLLICPSPRRILTDSIAARLRMACRLLRDPDERIREQATDMLRAGTTDMMKSAKMAGLEKIWSPRDLACLRQAASSSVAVLALADEASRSGLSQADAACLIRTLEDMAAIFADGDYPAAIERPAVSAASPTACALADLLPDFATPPADDAKAPSQKKKSGFLADDAFSNPDHVRFAVKGTAAVMLSYLTFKVLNWPGIHTCIITCFIVALPTMGEMVSKLTLRISGALVGGALGIAAIVFVMPHLNDITGFLVLVFVVSLIAAWVKTGDERIAYAGFQIGLAFYLTDLKGYGPTADMATARDRIVGIMLGNFITYAMFTSFWPASAFDRIGDGLRKLADSLKGQANASTPQARSDAIARTQSALLESERTLEYAMSEPAHMRTDLPRLEATQKALDDAAELSEELLVTPGRPDFSDRMARLEQIA